MIPELPIDFGALAASGATVLGGVIAGVMGIFVMVSLVNMGIKWVRRAFDSGPEDVKVDRTVRVRAINGNDVGYDHEVDGEYYVNVDWRDKPGNWESYL